jgi:hypothetical protein
MNAGIIAVMIPIVAIVCGTFITIAKMQNKRLSAGGASADVTGRMDALEQELEHVRQELAETQERVDFTERLLAKQKDAGRLGGQA